MGNPQVTYTNNNNDTVSIHRGRILSTIVTLEECKKTIENIKLRKSWYATEASYQRHLDTYLRALVQFSNP